MRLWTFLNHPHTQWSDDFADCEWNVPDDRRGLLLRNDTPERMFPPGRHSLACEHGRVEVRLLVPGPAGDLCLDETALSHPFERSLLFVDGVLVAILIPAALPGSATATWEGPTRSQPGLDPRHDPSPSAFGPGCAIVTLPLEPFSSDRVGIGQGTR